LRSEVRGYARARSRRARAAGRLESELQKMLLPKDRTTNATSSRIRAGTRRRVGTLRGRSVSMYSATRSARLAGGSDIRVSGRRRGYKEVIARYRAGAYSKLKFESEAIASARPETETQAAFTLGLHGGDPAEPTRSAT